MRVTAAVLYDAKKPVVIEDVELLEPGPHEVQVRWAANGVCHSDLHVMTGDYPHALPVVLGHVAAGGVV
jgi:Zn-dependent alcohol dehydrogenase